ncbi:MAG: CpsD/CapB family tyrosine-protein kinase [Acidobacteria bacterium]|nr:CpsD/CapB family tyrosine-protein kinase [Acidobacteriota bacterium]
MSEIFNFLKQTGTEKRKSPPSPEPEPEWKEPVSESHVEARKEISEETVLNDEVPSVPVEEEVLKADRFDLSGANQNLKISLDPFTIAGEQFRLLRTKLGRLKKEKGIKTVLITSSVPEEGKTFASSGLAGVFAQEPGKRVALLDCDMRKPRSGRNLGVNGSSSSIGMSEVLQGNIGFFDSLLKSSELDFYFLPSGSLPQNPTELLSSPLLEQTLKTAAANFDWIVIDSPPVLSLADATLLVPLCDAVILVVRANSTPAKLVKNTIDVIGRERISGIVFNRQRQKYPSRYYYKYYYGKSKKQKE